MVIFKIFLDRLRNGGVSFHVRIIGLFRDGLLGVILVGKGPKAMGACEIIGGQRFSAFLADIVFLSTNYSCSFMMVVEGTGTG